MTTMHLRTSNGWQVVPGISGVTLEPHAESQWDVPVKTLTSYHGSLEFFASPEVREAMGNFINAVARINEWIEARPRRSAMRTAYRAKTRRRNRRRK